MLCVESGADGVVRVAQSQPAAVADCTLVVLAPAEVQSNPFVLSMQDGAQVAGAILLVWGVAFALRMARRSINLGEFEHDE
jgi:hypothetical protein